MKKKDRKGTGGRENTYIQNTAIPSVSFSLIFLFLHTHSQKNCTQTAKQTVKNHFREEKTWLNPGHLSALLPFGEKGEKVWETEGGKKEYWGRREVAGCGRGTQRVLFLGLGRLGWISWWGDRSPRSHSSPSAVRIQFLICWLQNL